MSDQSPRRKVLIPFLLKKDWMEKLLVASIKGDSEFEGIEPQVFDDPINGKGMRVIRYRHDGMVDVYWQQGVRMDRNTFEVGKGTADFAETEITPARFEITETGIDVDVAFTDLQGRRNELRIKENTPGKQSFPLLAPVSANIENPIQFNIVFMPVFDMVRRSGCVFTGKIGSRTIKPDTIPLLMNGRRLWLARYADRPVIGIFNPPMDRPITADLTVPGVTQVDGMTITTDNTGRMTCLAVGEEPARVVLEFSPGFPNLSGFPAGASASGSWTIDTAGARITGGTYSVSGRDGSIAVELDVRDNWKPENIPFSIKILTTMVSLFRTWPSTYRWKGVIISGEKPSMTGKWERVRR